MYNRVRVSTYMFYYLGKFGQAILWPSLPDRATKKKENCRSLSILQMIESFLISAISSKKKRDCFLFWSSFCRF